MHLDRFLVRQLLGCLIFFVVSCKNEPEAVDPPPQKTDSFKLQAKFNRACKQIFLTSHLLKPGDIVTRTGNDFTSQSLRLLNRRDKTWSHCGIVNIENDSAVVYHALGGEWNPDQSMLREPFYKFADPAFNSGVAAFRPRLSKSTADCILKSVQSSYQRQVRFDMEFDLKTDDRLYCSELIYKAFQNCGSSNLIQPAQIQNFSFIGIDDIILQPGISAIARVSYR